MIAGRGITRRFGRRAAVDDLDLRVEPGERVAVLGPNGAGKTTLLRILAGLLRNDSGELEVCGHSYPDQRRAAQAQIGYLGHDPLVYLDLTPVQNLELYCDLYGLDGVSTLGALEQVGLLTRAHDPARSFSRGMLQRLAIARVQLHAPRLLLLDEPFSSLDARGLSVLEEVLDGLGDERALVVVTHDFDRARRHAERALVLQSGAAVYETTQLDESLSMRVAEALE